MDHLLPLDFLSNCIHIQLQFSSLIPGTRRCSIIYSSAARSVQFDLLSATALTSPHTLDENSLPLISISLHSAFPLTSSPINNSISSIAFQHKLCVFNFHQITHIPVPPSLSRHSHQHMHQHQPRQPSSHHSSYSRHISHLINPQTYKYRNNNLGCNHAALPLLPKTSPLSLSL